MPVTTELLARLRTLDDLAELAAAIGYEPAARELGDEARARLGLALPQLGIRRAALLGRHGHFRVYGAVLTAPTRDAVARIVERLERHSADRFMLLALGTEPRLLAAAAPAPAVRGCRPRQFRVALATPSRVAAEILGGLAPRPQDGALGHAARIADALADEGLTSRFFGEFARLHRQATDAVAGAGRSSLAERRDLTLVFLTRVLFLYFVQAKGWLAGRSDFLPSLLDPALARGHLFHRSVFEPLCFGALSTPVRVRTGAARALGPVPFLNGGLFERHALERRFASAYLPNETWRDLLDHLFERFHFTTRESDDADAVDPEMLGRVFEGLMASERRRGSGAYYTPRALLRDTVHAALDAALGDADVAVVRSVRILDPAVGSGAFLLEALTWLERRRLALAPGESPVERRRAILRDNLFGVDVDPMAVRLAELRLWLAVVADDGAAWHEVAPLPNLDGNLRQGDSLLSPLDASAATWPLAAPHVRAVAETRAEYFGATGRHKASLARAIRERERAIALAGAQAELDAVTSHLAEAAATTGRDLFGRRARRDARLDRTIRGWRTRRRELRRLAQRIASDDALPFFAYDVHFGDVMAAGGFDVVLGNPPWVRGERIDVTTRGRLAARYATFRPSPGSRGFAHLPDIAVAFVERALELVREGGVVAFLLPAKLLRAGYAGPLRAMLRRRSTLLAVDDRSRAEHGFAATVFPMILTLRRETPADDSTMCVRLAEGDTELRGTVGQGSVALDPTSPRSPWLALPDEAAAAVRAVLAAGPPLRTRFRPRLGVKTGANEVFVREADRADELPRACRAPAVHGADIRPFRARPSGALLAALDRAGRPLRAVPAEVARYLAPNAAALSRRVDANGAAPWALFRTDLVGPRWLVLWRDIAGALEAAVLERADAAAPLPLNTCYGVVAPDGFTASWLCAWLNSPLIGTTALALAERASGGAFRFSAATVGALPLPSRAGHPALSDLARAAERAAAGLPWDPDDLDALVADAIALAPAQAAVLARLGKALRRSAGGDR